MLHNYYLLSKSLATTLSFADRSLPQVKFLNSSQVDRAKMRVGINYACGWRCLLRTYNVLDIDFGPYANLVQVDFISLTYYWQYYVCLVIWMDGIRNVEGNLEICYKIVSLLTHSAPMTLNNFTPCSTQYPILSRAQFNQDKIMCVLIRV